MIGNKRNFAAALVVPGFEALEAWAKERGLVAASREDLVRLPEVVRHYQGLVEQMTADLASSRRSRRSRSSRRSSPRSPASSPRPSRSSGGWSRSATRP